MQAFATGEIVANRYRVTRVLGRGGMGLVVAGRDLRTGRELALKCVHPQHGGPQATERLWVEAAAVARVQHPNVVKVFDIIEDGEQVVLVMELLQGESLGTAMARGTMPFYVFIDAMLGAMQGVAAAHAQGVIHRDIKPDNIFMCRAVDGRPPVSKVLDFGVSKVIERRGPKLTEPGAPIGTLAYMSPEQLDGAHDVDARTDVYGFGAILFEALTGRLPHVGPTLPALLVSMISGPPTAPRELCPHVPAALSQLTLWALAGARQQRLPSLQQFIEELSVYAIGARRVRGFDPAALQIKCQRDGPESSGPRPLPQWHPHAAVAGPQPAPAALAAPVIDLPTASRTQPAAALLLRHRRGLVWGGAPLLAISALLLGLHARTAPSAAEKQAPAALRGSAEPAEPVAPTAVSTAPRPARSHGGEAAPSAARTVPVSARAGRAPTKQASVAEPLRRGVRRGGDRGVGRAAAIRSSAQHFEKAARPTHSVPSHREPLQSGRKDAGRKDEATSATKSQAAAWSPATELRREDF